MISQHTTYIYIYTHSGLSPWIQFKAFYDALKKKLHKYCQYFDNYLYEKVVNLEDCPKIYPELHILFKVLCPCMYTYSHLREPSVLAREDDVQ